MKFFNVDIIQTSSWCLTLHRNKRKWPQVETSEMRSALLRVYYNNNVQ